MRPAAPSAEWPDKPVRVIVPYSAGGANDLLGRVFAEQLSKTFGQQFFVENRTGGGGLIGTEAVARAAPDGYTLMISGMPSHVLAPAMNKNASFDPIKDFTHIAYLGGPPNVFVVHPSAGVNSFKELLALMRSQPDGVQYVSPSIGSVGNMVAEYVADKEKVKLVHIVYRGGGSAIQDLVAGHVKVGSMTLSTTQPHILAGKLKPLAISSEKRVPEFPDVPTLVELGYPELIVTDLVLAVRARPACRATSSTKLNAAVNKAMDLPEVQKHLDDRDGADQGDDARADDGVHAARSEPMGADGAAHRRNKMTSNAQIMTGEARWSRFLIALAAVFLASAMTTASAQSYPQRAVRFILPFGPGRRRRHHRPPDRGQAVDALGQAGGGREPSRRRRPRRHQRLHQRQRRPHAAVRAGLDLSRRIPTPTTSCPTTPSATCCRSSTSRPS